MVRALIVGLAWLACTAAISLVIGRAIRRADARHEEERGARRVRSAVPTARRPDAGSDGAVARRIPDAPAPAQAPVVRGSGPGSGDSCALARPRGHGLPPPSRRRRHRRAP